MKVYMPPHSRCIRCGGKILDSAILHEMYCEQCKQVWKLGPEGCWEADFITSSESEKDYLEKLTRFARRFHKGGT